LNNRKDRRNERDGRTDERTNERTDGRTDQTDKQTDQTAGRQADGRIGQDRQTRQTDQTGQDQTDQTDQDQTGGRPIGPTGKTDKQTDGDRTNGMADRTDGPTRRNGRNRTGTPIHSIQTSIPFNLHCIALQFTSNHHHSTQPGSKSSHKYHMWGGTLWGQKLDRGPLVAIDQSFCTKRLPTLSGGGRKKVRPAKKLSGGSQHTSCPPREEVHMRRANNTHIIRGGTADLSTANTGGHTHVR